MATFLVTFPIGGPLRDCYSTVEAETEHDARLATADAYGTGGWGGVYPESEMARAVPPYTLTHVPFGDTVGSLMVALAAAVDRAKADR